MTLEAFTVVCLGASIWSLLCRVYQMDPKHTKRIVFASYFVLAMCAFGALILPVHIAKAALAAGLAVFLLIGARRWRDGQPEDTRRPAAGAPTPMPPGSLERVSGGSKAPEQVP